ncbi:MAG: hypothetical protein HN348_29450 [Proteobacteria bacterium]|nr:hypothetical protein [Pseudomonadota bacterium]
MKKDSRLIAGINAGMYEPSLKATFFMKTASRTSQSSVHSNGSAWLLLDSQTPDVPVLVDRNCVDLPALRQKYRAQAQSFRLVGCDQKPVWKPSKRIWSHALIGRDSRGRFLFIHARSPWSTHQISEILLGLPLDIQQLMYGEGGPEAQLSVRSGDNSIDLVGSYETGFMENDDNHRGWTVPNVVVVRRRDPRSEGDRGRF